MSKNILFITEQLFKDRTGASNNIDGKQLFPMIKVAGDIYLQPALGSALYKRLQSGVDANNLTINEKTLIDDYITDTLIWYTMSMLPMTMGFQLFSKGFLQKTSEESNTPSRGDMEILEKKYLSMAEFYKSRLIAYLKENFNLFYEYINYGIAFDTIFPEQKAYTCPIYLGDDYGIMPYVNSQSQSQAPLVAVYTSIGGESTFNVNALYGRTCKLAFRSGLQKTIVNTTTTNTGEIQINNNVVTLPTGDIAMVGEIFNFLYN
jgi:hypothetical protein